MKSKHGISFMNHSGSYSGFANDSEKNITVRMGIEG